MLLINENIKQYYRFVEFVSKLVGCELPHERFKLIALNKYKSESKEEIKVNALKDSYLYLMNNSTQVLTRELLIKTYYLLTSNILSSEVVESLLEEYYMHIDEPTMQLTSHMHCLILNKVIDRIIEFAFIISNYVLSKNNKNNLVPYEWIFEEYYEVIKNNKMDEMFIMLLKMNKNKKITDYELIINIEDVISRLKEKASFIKKRYLVKNLYLYGSIVKETNHLSSDLDLLVNFNENLINREREQIKMELNKYLEKELNTKVDIIDFTHALNKLDIGEMENIITIIKEEK